VIVYCIVHSMVVCFTCQLHAVFGNCQNHQEEDDGKLDALLAEKAARKLEREPLQSKSWVRCCGEHIGT
jgi:hypothetical protein